MIFEALFEASENDELMLVDGGMCHWHLRNDGQITIKEIISTRKGAGSEMLNRLLHNPQATSIFAKCPIDLPANEWYKKRGFVLEGSEITKSQRVLNLWRLSTDVAPRIVNGVELYYCAGGNLRLARIAISHGLNYGSRIPSPVYFRPSFCDQDWKNPDKEKYIAGLAIHRPAWASVIDIEREEQIPLAIEWAEEASQHVRCGIIFIPKLHGIISSLPRIINGKEVRLGYSVPTEYGGTTVPPIEFSGWNVHLLGGSPKNQLICAQLLNVVSADCNYIQLIAVKYGDYWHSDYGRMANVRLPYETAFEQSVKHYIKSWEERNIKTKQRIMDFMLDM